MRETLIVKENTSRGQCKFELQMACVIAFGTVSVLGVPIHLMECMSSRTV